MLIILDPSREIELRVKMLYEMNKESHIVIETPVGMTDSITVHEIVKKGTIFGPKLCSTCGNRKD